MDLDISYAFVHELFIIWPQSDDYSISLPKAFGMRKAS